MLGCLPNSVSSVLFAVKSASCRMPKAVCQLWGGGVDLNENGPLQSIYSPSQLQDQEDKGKQQGAVALAHWPEPIKEFQVPCAPNLMLAHRFAGAATRHTVGKSQQ